MLTEDQTALRAKARAFAEAELDTDLARRDRAGAQAPEDWLADWQKLGRYGVLGAIVPQAYGGRGLDVVSAIAELEGIGQGSADNGLTLGINGQNWAVIEPILYFGTDAQKARWLPGLIDGSKIGAHGMTERTTGSNALGLQTRAEKAEGGYVLNGEKVYVGLAPHCDVAVVFASTQPEAGGWGLSAFIVSTADEGFTRGEAEAKMGLRTTPLGALRLTNCFVPEDRRIGDEGDGGGIFHHTMEWERAFIFSSHVGRMARQLEICAEYARGREVFGSAIDGYQSVSNRLAEMRLRLETSRLLLYNCARLKAADAPCAPEAAMTKLHISEAFVASSLDAIRIHGGHGYMEAAGIERDLRDAMGGVIYSGTSDIQRQMIASSLSGGVG